MRHAASETPAPPPPYGGFTEVARRLSGVGPRAVSRQGVRAWWTRRDRNGFPEHHHLNEDGWKQWDIAEVRRWYALYTPPVVCHWGPRKERGKGSRAE